MVSVKCALLSLALLVSFKFSLYAAAHFCACHSSICQDCCLFCDVLLIMFFRNIEFRVSTGSGMYGYNAFFKALSSKERRRRFDCSCSIGSLIIFSCFFPRKIEAASCLTWLNRSWPVARSSRHRRHNGEDRELRSLHTLSQDFTGKNNVGSAFEASLIFPCSCASSSNEAHMQA